MTSPSVFFVTPGTTGADFGAAPAGAELIDIRGDAPFKGRTVSPRALEELSRLNRHWYFRTESSGVRARLDGASLVGARLDGAILDGASLVRASLDGARLDGARLVGAILDGASLAPIRDDLYDVLGRVPAEVPALLAALRDGKVDGSTYSGSCACLIGTIANARGCAYSALSGVTPDADRPIERWFLGIRPGLPVDHPVVAITIGWVEAWLAAREGT